MGEAIVYGMLDPRDGTLCYVGVTRRTLKQRFHSHHSYDKTKTDPRNRFVGEMLALGLKPTGIELERVPAHEWEEAEQFWIGYYRMLGCQLLNGTAGGRTVPPGMLAAVVGVPKSQEHRDRLRAANLGKKQSEATKAKVSAAMKNREFSPAHRENLSVANQAATRQSGISARNRSGFKGVSFNKRLQRWKATICVDSKNRHLGYHQTAEAAAMAYDDAARVLFGADAALNFAGHGERSAR